MKKIIALLLVAVMVLSLVPAPATATSYSDILGIDETKYDMDAYYQELWINYETNTSSLWNYICGDKCNTYVQIANHFKGNGWYEFATRWTDQELTKERYVEILVNLMTLMDYSTHDMIEKQVNADTLKTFGDYALDVSEILVGTVTLHSAFGSRVTEPMQKIATAMSLASGAADLTVDTIEAYQYLDWTLQTYENHDLFLSAIIQNTDDELLRDAAIELSDIVGKAFYCKVNAVSDISENTAEYIGKDVFFDTIVLDKMLKDASILDLSESDLATLDLIKNTYSVFTTSLSYIQDWSVFISDMLGGSSDVMNRYNEMCALTAIREALINQVESYRSNIKDATNYVDIGKLCILMKDLVCVNYRGEYCVHEMLVHDGQAFSLVVKWSGEVMTYDEIFERIKLRTSAYIDAIDSIFPDLQFYRLEDCHADTIQFDGDITDYYWYLNIQSWEIFSFEEDGSVNTYWTEHPLTPSEDTVPSESELELASSHRTYTFDGRSLIIFNPDSHYQIELDYYHKEKNPANIIDSSAANHIAECNGVHFFYETDWTYDSLDDNATYLVRLGKKGAAITHNDTGSVSNRIIGEWGSEGSVGPEYTFFTNGTCESWGMKVLGEYAIDQNLTLYIVFPWTSEKYTWSEKSFEEFRKTNPDENCWYFTETGILRLNNKLYYRDGIISNDYNIDGSLMAKISGAWFDKEQSTEYRIFEDGTAEISLVFADQRNHVYHRDLLYTSKVEILDDTHANLISDTDDWGQFSICEKLEYDNSADILYINSNACVRAEFIG